MASIIIAIVIGLFAGGLSGMFGIGGGILIVPALVFLLGFTQHKAQGTSLGMLIIPVGILGVLNYHRAENVDWRTVLLLATGFFLGSYLGSKSALTIDPLIMKRCFAVFLVAVAAWMWFSPTKTPPAQTPTPSEVPTA